MSRLVNFHDVLRKAHKEGYAVPHLNLNNLEWAQSVLQAVQEEQSPVILGVSEGANKYMGGPEVVAAMVNALMENMNITVPVTLHLDHGQSFEFAKRAIDAGFTSVMLDHSKLPFEQNLADVKEVVAYAHPHGASVEAEVGTVGGVEDGITAGISYADREEAKRMVEEGHVDVLAAALGSVHGQYASEPKLGFAEMKDISEYTDAPLVLHGASGIPDDQIKKAIANGTNKININTELQEAWALKVRELLNNDPKVYDPRKVMAPGKEGIILAAKQKIHLLGSNGKA